MTPTEVREKAEACDGLAMNLSHQTDRDFMRLAADQWRQMANQIEAVQADQRRMRGR